MFNLRSNIFLSSHLNFEASVVRLKIDEIIEDKFSKSKMLMQELVSIGIRNATVIATRGTEILLVLIRSVNFSDMKNVNKYLLLIRISRATSQGS